MPYVGRFLQVMKWKREKGQKNSRVYRVLTEKEIPRKSSPCTSTASGPWWFWHQLSLTSQSEKHFLHFHPHDSHYVSMIIVYDWWHFDGGEANQSSASLQKSTKQKKCWLLSTCHKKCIVDSCYTTINNKKQTSVHKILRIIRELAFEIITVLH